MSLMSSHRLADAALRKNSFWAMKSKALAMDAAVMAASVFLHKSRKSDHGPMARSTAPATEAAKVCAAVSVVEALLEDVVVPQQVVEEPDWVERGGGRPSATRSALERSRVAPPLLAPTA